MTTLSTMRIAGAQPVGAAGGLAPPAPQPTPTLQAAERPAPSLEAPASAAPGLAQARAGASVRVWDMSSGIEQALDSASAARSEDPVIRTAHDNASKVDAFLRDSFGRDGWDDKGSPLQVVVHAPNEDGTPGMNNAYWDVSTERIYLGDGDGTVFQPLGNALDVMAHEATHAVVDSEVNLRYSGQQGGINESFADVLAALADPDDWQIGEDVFTPDTPGDSIRDLTQPRYGHVDDLPEGVDVDVHDMSGIPSLAAVRAAEKIGRGDMGKVWYSALVDHLDSRSGFSGAARATLKAAALLHGPDSPQFAAIDDAWDSVGVDPRLSSRELQEVLEGAAGS